MDREIPKEEKRRAALRRWLRAGAATLAVGAACIVVTRLAAGGSIVPERQEIIVSPISTRIVEVYHRTGDSVEAGTPLLRLDLQDAETEYRKALDDEQMRRLQIEKLRVSQNTQLTDMQMKIEVAQMALNGKLAQMQGERYLDSIGSGTTERVRQAELDYNTARLELEQLRKQYANGRKAAEAERRVQELDLAMFRKGLEAMRRTLQDAQVRSPRRAVLTYINDNIGAQIAQGEQVATVADLSSMKAECTIADGYSDRVAVGSRVR